jgi:hypothetical protein
LRDSPDAARMGFSANLTALINRSELQQKRRQVQLQSRLVLLLELVSQVHTQKEDNADLALLLCLEANRIADLIKQMGDLPGESSDSVIVEARASLVAALVANPYIIKFLHGHSDSVSSKTQRSRPQRRF